MDGQSGVIIGVESCVIVVIGVHVGCHDDSVKPPAIHRSRHDASTTDIESVPSTTDSLVKSVYGQTAYCLICIANRVDDLQAMVANDRS